MKKQPYEGDTCSILKSELYEIASQKRKCGSLRRSIAGVFWTAILLTALVCQAQGSEVSELIRGEVEQIRYAKDSFVGESRIGSTGVLPQLYERRDFEPAWKDGKQAGRYIDFVRQIDQEGLNPEDYHLEALDRLRSEIHSSSNPGAQIKAHFDLLLTDSLLRMVYHLAFGKVDPVALHAGWNFSRDIGDIDPVVFIQEGIDSGNIDGFIRQIIPDLPIYTRLKSGLADYRRIEEQGGWSPITGSEVLKPGMAGSRVAELGNRLAVTGDLEGPRADSEIFDDVLEEAVKRFQSRHGLDADGVVGGKTLEALNVSVGDRIDQVRINMERMRWFLHDMPSTFVVVDIAGFHAYLLRGQEVLWAGKAQVGTSYRQTPCFRAEIEYLVFNPTWTVPPGILAKDTLPTIKKDPGYLARMNMTVLNRSGKVIDPKSVKWSQYSGRNFPYILRQEPGPNNALGRIKFIFPNQYFVFLHDTPSKSLFEKTSRAFSSGCIRIERPFELAELLLNDSTKWRQEDMQNVLNSARERTVFLPEHMVVMLLYVTAEVDKEGKVYFRKDIYGRDKALLKELDGEFKIHRKVEVRR